MEKNYKLDAELSKARDTTEMLDSVEWFASDLLDTLEYAKGNGLNLVPANEVISKIRGIHKLLYHANKEISEHLTNAHKVLDKLNETKKA